MREGRLRWFGHVKRRPQPPPVRRAKALLVDGLRRRGRPKLRNALRDRIGICRLVEKLLVLLRDGRKLLGILRSFDQFANAVLEGACERVIVGDLYCDIPLGLYVIRGENVVLIGELELEKEELPPHMTRVSEAEIKRAQKVERDAMDLKGTMRKRMEFLDMD
ncbi:Sm-like protein LSM1B [Tanacetum coccineum]